MKHFFSTSLLSASNSGYTLIEVLIALAIFSIGLMAMGALQTSSLMATRGITDKTQAWAILEDRLETIKSLPFYVDQNGIDDDLDGTIDENLEQIPALMGGDHTANWLNNQYTVRWQVVDDQPIPQPAVGTLPGIAGTRTVCKTITVWVTRFGGNHLNDAEVLATAESVKTWAGSGLARR